jgi:hypothetical protein
MRNTSIGSEKKQHRHTDGSPEHGEKRQQRKTIVRKNQANIRSASKISATMEDSNSTTTNAMSEERWFRNNNALYSTARDTANGVRSLGSTGENFLSSSRFRSDGRRCVSNTPLSTLWIYQGSFLST